MQERAKAHPCHAEYDGYDTGDDIPGAKADGIGHRAGDGQAKGRNRRTAAAEDGKDAALHLGLYGALQARVPAGATLCLDVPEGNLAAVALAERHRLAVSFETARMYAGGAPAPPLRRVFGVTTFELG